MYGKQPSNFLFVSKALKYEEVLEQFKQTKTIKGHDHTEKVIIKRQIRRYQTN